MCKLVETLFSKIFSCTGNISCGSKMFPFLTCVHSQHLLWKQNVSMFSCTNNICCGSKMFQKKFRNILYFVIFNSWYPVDLKRPPQTKKILQRKHEKERMFPPQMLGVCEKGGNVQCFPVCGSLSLTLGIQDIKSRRDRALTETLRCLKSANMLNNINNKT